VVAPAGWPDTAVDSVSMGSGIELRAASVRGLEHRAYGTPRQDAYSLGNTDEPLVVTVCDGVGSLGLSHEAAQLAVRRVPVLVGEALSTGDRHWTDGISDWAPVFARLSDELADLRDGRAGAAGEGPANGLATTVLIAVVGQDEPGAWKAQIAWRGDSTAQLLRAGEWIRIGVAEDVDSDRPNAVSALPSEDHSFAAETVHLRPGDVLALVSDGIAKPLGDGSGLVGGALADWWAQPPTPLDFAAQVGFKRRTQTDDRTAVVLWIPAVSTQPPEESDAR
jgi:serine/threonine protein phosphatase PrpC